MHSCKNPCGTYGIIFCVWAEIYQRISHDATFFVLGGLRSGLISIQRETARENPVDLPIFVCAGNPPFRRRRMRVLSLPQAPCMNSSPQILPKTFSRPLAGFAAPRADQAPRTWRVEVPPPENEGKGSYEISYPLSG